MTTVVRLMAVCRVFVAALLLYPSVGFTQVDPLPSWNDGAVKQAIAAFVARGDEARFGRFCAARRAHRDLRQRRHFMVRAADVRADGVRA